MKKERILSIIDSIKTINTVKDECSKHDELDDADIDDLIAEEYEAIADYEAALKEATSDRVKEQLTHIMEEEKEHVRELEELKAKQEPVGDGVSPMTYAKLKEKGYSHKDWEKWSDEEKVKKSQGEESTSKEGSKKEEGSTGEEKNQLSKEELIKIAKEKRPWQKNFPDEEVYQAISRSDIEKWNKEFKEKSSKKAEEGSSGKKEEGSEKEAKQTVNSSTYEYVDRMLKKNRISAKPVSETNNSITFTGLGSEFNKIKEAFDNPWVDIDFGPEDTGRFTLTFRTSKKSEEGSKSSSQFEEKKKQNQYIDEDLEKECTSVEEELKAKETAANNKVSEYIDSGKFKNWDEIRKDEKAMKMIKEAFKLSKAWSRIHTYVVNMKLAKEPGSWTGPDKDQYESAKQVLEDLKKK